MLKSSKDHQAGYTKQQHSCTSTEVFQDISFWKRRLPVTSNATTAQEKSSTNTWTSTCSGLLSMRQQSTDLVHSVITCLESSHSILRLLKQSNIPRKRIDAIQSSLLQTELYLIGMLMKLCPQGSTNLSGHGDQKRSSRKKRRGS